MMESNTPTTTSMYEEMIKMAVRLREWTTVEYWFNSLGNYLQEEEQHAHA